MEYKDLRFFVSLYSQIMGMTGFERPIRKIKENKSKGKAK
jgi:hypothetical protein